MSVVCFSRYKPDVMNLLLVVYLYLYVATAPANCDQSGSLSNDSNIAELTEDYRSDYNCSECNLVEWKSCTCLDSTNGCLICCSDTSDSDVQCCYCDSVVTDDCRMCWKQQRLHLLTMAQISISIIFGFGVFAVIIAYCKICKRTRQTAQQRRAILQQEQETSMYCSTIDGLRERPPPYSEVCSAPPTFSASCNNSLSLYAMIYNRACMQEAPPSYPETPQPREKLRSSNETSSSISDLNSIQYI